MPGVEVSYQVRAVDQADNRSDLSSPAVFTAGGPDTTPPTVPAGLVTVANGGGSIEIGWAASTDDLSGVASYLVYRDGAYLGWTDAATLSFVDTGRVPGVTYVYEIRAVDVATNRSAKSLPLLVTAE